MIATLEMKPDTMNEPSHEFPWEEQLAALLEDLSQVQEELLQVLVKKRQCMAGGDARGMAALQPAEESLGQRLQQCHDRRTQLLSEATVQGLPGSSLGELATALKRQGAGDLCRDVKQTSARMRLLQHQSLTNWVLAQKALLHVAQMLEIIATGGRLQPTYGKELSPHARGSLVDQEA